MAWSSNKRVNLKVNRLRNNEPEFKHLIQNEIKVFEVQNQTAEIGMFFRNEKPNWVRVRIGSEVIVYTMFVSQGVSELQAFWVGRGVEQGNIKMFASVL